MLTVYRLYLRWMVRWAARAIPFASIAILTLDRIGLPYKVTTTMVHLLAIYIFFISTMILTSKNLQWLMTLPISKRGIILLNYCVKFTMALMIAASTFITIGIVNLVKVGQFQIGDTFFFLPDHVRGIFIDIFRNGLSISRHPVQDWAILLTIITGFNSFLLLIWAGGATQSTQSKPFYVRDPREKKIVACFVAFWAVAYLFHKYLLTGWIAFVGATLFFCILLTKSSIQAMGIFGAEKRRWLAIAYLLAFLEIGAILAIAVHGLKPNSTDRVAASIRFLGPWSGRDSERALAKILQSDISVRDLEKIGQVYQEKVSGGEPIKQQEGLSLSFRGVISSKNSLETIQSTVLLFDPSTLDAEDLRVLFERISAISNNGYFAMPVYGLVDARVNTDETIRFMESQDRLAIFYGLLRARYHRDEAFIPAILRNLERYDDKLRLESLLTLAILCGKRIGLDDYVALRATGKLAAKFHKASCQSFQGIHFMGLQPADEGLINICVRENLKHRKLWIAILESGGWIDFPLSNIEQKRIRDALELPDGNDMPRPAK